jgi:hypothetical protein
VAKSYPDDEEEGFSDKPSSPKKRDYDDDDYDDRDDDDLNIKKRRIPEGDVPNYMTQAVMVTLCCCIPFGIVAIVKASSVNTLLAKGEYEQAVAASEEAKKYCWIGFVLGIVANGAYLALQMAGEMGRR